MDIQERGARGGPVVDDFFDDGHGSDLNGVVEHEMEHLLDVRVVQRLELPL